MKKLVLLLVMCAFAAAAVAQQSLGDLARANRARKSPVRSAAQFNDETMLRRTAPASIIEPAASKTGEEAPAAKEAAAGEVPQINADDFRTWKIEYLQKQIDAQEQEIAVLQRELNVAHGEAGLLASAYYGDAGVMLRDPERYFEAVRAQLEEIGYKKGQLAAASQKLADLQEQQRKARAELLFGSKLPSSVQESAQQRKLNEPSLAKQSRDHGETPLPR